MRKLSAILSLVTVLATLFLHQALAASPSFLPPDPIQPTVPQIVISITLRGEEQPTYHIISDDLPQEQQLHATPMILHFPGQLSSSSAPSLEAGPDALTTDLVDNWDLLLEEDFEGVFPQGPCTVYDGSNDGFERTWDDDNFRPFAGSWAGWPAKGGVNGVDPAVSDYPANLDSWLICGPFDLSDARDFLVRFTRWLEINDADDYLFYGASLDGHTFYGLAGHGVSNWVTYHVWFQGVGGDDSVWVGWLFHSDGDADRAEGAWIDGLEVWRYNTPARTCGGLDAGDKGVVVNPYEWVGEAEYPIIRAGDTLVVDGLVAADVRWVRMVFRQREGIVRQQEYDRMVDTLCANGISVLGVVNHETLVRQDFNDPATAVAYRHEFTSTVGFIADRFEGRITYWEVWNEENYDSNPDPIETGPPYVRPSLYAPLLDATYQSIKAANPQAKVLFGGLASAWGDSRQYFEQVYQELDDNLGGARPFDYFAIHPYFDRIHGLDPEMYMHSDPDYDTILDKFMKTMSDNGDGDKTVWVTEVGWNSAKGHPDVACLWDIVVTAEEQAEYLKSGFDILFNEVELWQRPGTQAVEKVIWYQYMDVGIPYEMACPSGMAGAGGMAWKGNVPAGGVWVTQNAVPWWFGLYQGDKQTPKPARCAFLAYPNECHHVFLPLTTRNQVATGR